METIHRRICRRRFHGKAQSSFWTTIGFACGITPSRLSAVPLHRHVRDAVAVWVEGDKLRATPRGGASSVITQMKFTATYSRRGTVHTEEAIEGTPRAYVFELK